MLHNFGGTLGMFGSAQIINRVSFLQKCTLYNLLRSNFITGARTPCSERSFTKWRSLLPPYITSTRVKRRFELYSKTKLKDT